MRTHILTVVVEDYFHVAALRGAIRPKHWDRLDPRLDASLAIVLDLCDVHQVKATFFVFGCVAEARPEVVQRIVEHGHEVASRGYAPRTLDGMTRADLVDDLSRARDALESAGSGRILGYRSPTWLRDRDLWVLDVLAEEGYAYDSSINPILRRFASDPEKTRIHQHRHADGTRSLWELPVASFDLGGLRIPISGGNYVRQIPHTLLKRLVDRKSSVDSDPLVFYFMLWELDRDQPRVQGISALNRLRHYRNLAKTRWVFEDYFTRYRFQGIADHLGLDKRQAPAPRAAASTSAAAPADLRTVRDAAPAVPSAPVIPITLVIPIFNEQQNIGYLRRTLGNFRRRLGASYRVHFTLVDDASTDGTLALLQQSFRDVPDCAIVSHPQNRGVAAAMLTGIRAAPTEIVCTIDCDCSYDPHDLEAMIPLLDNADMVTASPYHPDGHVLNVPGWRLVLSKTLSRLYSIILKERIHTYTSCCRAFRKSRMADLTVEHGGFLGTAEMLIELKLSGGRIVEHPATLEARLFGESKMKIARTIVGHLGLIRELGARRARHQAAASSSPKANASPGAAA